jgi:hypothetical protein
LAKLPATGILKFEVDENNDHYHIDLQEESSDIDVHPVHEALT